MKIARKVIEDAMYDAELEPEDLRTDYSGRAMYGRTCVGIVSRDPSAVVRLALALMTADEEDAAYALAYGASTDSMGLSMITYWPNLEIGEEDD